jgi:fimbrial chaperone protein
MLKFRLFFCFIASLMFLSASGPGARAMVVEPMLLEMTTSGKASRETIKVTNNGTQALPAEIAISRVELGLNGEQKARPAGDEFLLYPPQAMIPPGGSQVFRVQWVGDPDIAASRIYTFSIAQVPVKLAHNTSGIQLMMSVGVTVNISPPNGRSAIEVLSAAPVTDKSGKRFASLTVKNPGNKHAYLKQSAIHLSGGGWSADLPPQAIEQKLGLGIVQPGKERRFILPVEVPKTVSAIQATVNFQPERP